MTTTETVTIQYPDRDEQRIDLYVDEFDAAGLLTVEVDDDDSHIVLKLSTTEAEQLIAKLAVTVARARMAA